MFPKWPVRLAALCTALGAAAPASAQVQVNSSALQQLAGPKAAPAKPHHHHATRQTAHHEHAESRRHEEARRHETARNPRSKAEKTTEHKTGRHETAKHETGQYETGQHEAGRQAVTQAQRQAAAPPLPLPPPVPMRVREAAARLPPPPPLVRRPVPPKPPAPPPAHLTIDFLGRAASLGDVERQDIERFLHKLKTKKHRFLIRATAPGQQGNASVARRLSLQRGLAVQSVLVAAGISPERIIVQSLGDPPGADTRRVVLSELP